MRESKRACSRKDTNNLDRQSMSELFTTKRLCENMCASRRAIICGAIAGSEYRVLRLTHCAMSDVASLRADSPPADDNGGSHAKPCNSDDQPRDGGGMSKT